MDLDLLNSGDRVTVHGSRPVKGTVIEFVRDSNGMRVNCKVEIDGGSIKDCLPDEITRFSEE